MGGFSIKSNCITNMKLTFHIVIMLFLQLGTDPLCHAVKLVTYQSLASANTGDIQ